MDITSISLLEGAGAGLLGLSSILYSELFVCTRPLNIGSTTVSNELSKNSVIRAIMIIINNEPLI